MNKLALITAVIVSTFAINSFAADTVVSTTEHHKVAQKETKQTHKEIHHKKHKKEETKKEVKKETKAVTEKTVK